MDKLKIKRVLLTFIGICVIVTVYACKTTGVTDLDDGGEDGKKVFKAGASIIDITDTPPAGYIVHDKLHARTLVLDDGTTKLVFVIVDEQTVSREVFDEAKKIILTENRIDPRNVMMSATHTHSAGSRAAGSGTTALGYSVRYSWNQARSLDAYQTFLARQIASAVRSAVLNLEPATIGWGKVDVPQWTFNRRWLMQEPVVNPYGGYDQVLFNPGINNTNKVESVGPIDPEVSFIAVQALDGRPISVLANYSTHYAGGVPTNHISADYFAVFADKLSERLGTNNQDRPFVGIMSNGTSGDVSTTNYAGGQPAFSPYEKMQAVASDIAEEIYRVYQDLTFHSSVSLASNQTDLSLQIRRAGKPLMDWVNEVLARPSDAPLRHPRDRTQANYVMQLEREWPDNISVPLQVFKIGDLAVSAIPFEVFAETGLELKSASPFKNTFTIGLGNGWYGYLPTPEQHELGGWETWMGGSNKVQKDASVLITGRLLEMLGTLKGK